MADVQVEILEMTECSKPPRWTEIKSFCVGSCFHWSDFDNDVHLLDPQKYTSVSEALVALNNQSVDSQSFCAVFSRRKHAFYLLWPSDKAETDVEQFLTRFHNSLAIRTCLEQKKDCFFHLNEARIDGHGSPSPPPSDSSGASTTLLGHQPPSDSSGASGSPSPSDSSHDIGEPATKNNPVASSLTMLVEDLNMDQVEFDPSQPYVRTQLLRKLGCPANAEIRKLHDNAGSFNDGVWMVSDSAFDGLVLKLVPHHRVNEAMKTDTEKYIELLQRCPNIVSDFSVTFPVKIFQVRGPSGDRRKDLIVMRTAPGLQITQHLFQKYNEGRAAHLPIIFEEFGAFLHKVHRKYRNGQKCMQHGDCQPSNVFYDEFSGHFTLVDVADFGFGPFLAQGGEDDVEHFVDSLYQLLEWYGRILLDTCAQAFREGYTRDRIRSSLTMMVVDLNMDQVEFDPSEPCLRSQLLRKLSCPANAEIRKLHDNAGSFNDGVWMVSDSAVGGLVLKLVPHRRVTEARKTDTEKYIELLQRCPNIVSDLSVTFPIKIFQLKGPSGDLCKDLIVMRKAPGLQLTQHLFQHCTGARAADLQSMFKDFGNFLRKVHGDYRNGKKSMQHGDCQPSNVFYDEVSGRFTLVDVADFGFGPFLAQGGEDDVEHFVDGLYQLLEWYGRILLDSCAQAFREGYSLERSHASSPRFVSS